MELVISKKATSQKNSLAKDKLVENILLIPNRFYHGEDIDRLMDHFDSSFRVHILSSQFPTGEKVESFVQGVKEELDKKRIKNFTLIGVGTGSSIAQAYAILNPRSVRRLVLCNATTRIKPGKIVKLIDRLEKYLPLGLPLKKLNNNFDSRPSLHRIHCPTLVAYSIGDTRYTIEQSNYIAKNIPNAWIRELKTRPIDEFCEISLELNEILLKFVEVPVKRPQKNL